MSDKVKVLVTGATGFVGRAVIEEFKKYVGYEVYGLSGNKSESGLNEQRGIEKVFRCDISDYETLKQVETIKQIDFVIHCAGLAHQFGEIIETEFYRVNVQGTENICKLTLQLGAKRLIHLSSVAVYGNFGRTEVDETFKCQPQGVYAESKFAAESSAEKFCKDNSIGLTILRLATVIGENDRGNTARLITTIDGNRFIWIGNGRNLKSLIYKNDAARAIFKVVSSIKSAGTGIYNLCGESVSMKTIVETVSESLGKKKPRLKIPESVFRLIFGLNNRTLNLQIFSKYEKTIKKWLSDDIFSGGKFKTEFNFNSETRIVNALALQVKDYLKQKKGI